MFNIDKPSFSQLPTNCNFEITEEMIYFSINENLKKVELFDQLVLITKMDSFYRSREFVIFALNFLHSLRLKETRKVVLEKLNSFITQELSMIIDESDLVNGLLSEFFQKLHEDENFSSEEYKKYIIDSQCGLALCLFKRNPGFLDALLQTSLVRKYNIDFISHLSEYLVIARPKSPINYDVKYIIDIMDKNGYQKLLFQQCISFFSVEKSDASYRALKKLLKWIYFDYIGCDPSFPIYQLLFQLAGEGNNKKYFSILGALLKRDEVNTYITEILESAQFFNFIYSHIKSKTLSATNLADLWKTLNKILLIIKSTQFERMDFYLERIYDLVLFFIDSYILELPFNSEYHISKLFCSYFCNSRVESVLQTCHKMVDEILQNALVMNSPDMRIRDPIFLADKFIAKNNSINQNNQISFLDFLQYFIEKTVGIYNYSTLIFLEALGDDDCLSDDVIINLLVAYSDFIKPVENYDLPFKILVCLLKIAHRVLDKNKNNVEFVESNRGMFVLLASHTLVSTTRFISSGQNEHDSVFEELVPFIKIFTQDIVSNIGLDMTLLIISILHSNNRGNRIAALLTNCCADKRSDIIFNCSSSLIQSISDNCSGARILNVLQFFSHLSFENVSNDVINFVIDSIKASSEVCYGEEYIKEVVTFACEIQRKITCCVFVKDMFFQLVFSSPERYITCIGDISFYMYHIEDATSEDTLKLCSLILKMSSESLSRKLNELKQEEFEYFEIGMFYRGASLLFIKFFNQIYEVFSNNVKDPMLEILSVVTIPLFYYIPQGYIIHTILEFIVSFDSPIIAHLFSNPRQRSFSALLVKRDALDNYTPPGDEPADEFVEYLLLLYARIHRRILETNGVIRFSHGVFPNEEAEKVYKEKVLSDLNIRHYTSLRVYNPKTGINAGFVKPRFN